MAAWLTGVFLLAIVTGAEKEPAKVYQVRILPEARITVDGLLDEPAWGQANAERGFRFPWQDDPAPDTEFRALCDSQTLYFSFRVHDEDIVVAEIFDEELDAIGEDRVELFFALDEKLARYFSLEIDSRGRYLDSQATYYRKFDYDWDFPGLRVAATPLPQGYIVEGLIPLASLRALGFPPLESGRRIRFGLFRAEFRHGPGPGPVEGWMSWVDPHTDKPDFHLPSAFGYLQAVK